ncbi:TetR/AcrR family transcriptional regulator [Streptomyces sp. QTS52]
MAGPATPGGRWRGAVRAAGQAKAQSADATRTGTRTMAAIMWRRCLWALPVTVVAPVLAADVADMASLESKKKDPSMQDVLKEVDLSAGAVYRYFSGKEELIAAVVTEMLQEAGDAFGTAGEQDPPPPPDVIVGEVMGRMPGRRTRGRPSFPA